ncbi:hypothetical protein Tco_1068390 [Tanacetum coccineum]|uniref:Uncharacterized protein n=1 Tax=Tanacetum coccineum TaxID=301880 RepID=A0ABQ5HFK0_9ASTR
MESSDPVDTPMVEKSKPDEDTQSWNGGHPYVSHSQGLWYPNDSSSALIAYADFDHAGCQDTRRSTSGSMQLLGDRLVSWSSKSQKSAAISSTEAEYIALSEQVENGVVELYFVNTEYQLADIFTKALGRERIEFSYHTTWEVQVFNVETLKQLADEARRILCQNRRDLPRDIPLDSVVVLRYEKRSKSENKGKVPTEMELVLEQTQQGTSYEVSVSAEGVEE